MEKLQHREDTKVHLLNPPPTFGSRSSALLLILGHCKDTTNVNRGTIIFDK